MADKENRKCVKCGCTTAQDGVKLFRYPKPGVSNLLKCTIWAKFILPNEHYASIQLQKKLYSEHRMLCERHFNEADFTDDTKTRLTRTAVPLEHQPGSADVNFGPVICCQPGPSIKIQPGPSTSSMKDITNLKCYGREKESKNTKPGDNNPSTSPSTSMPQDTSIQSKDLREKCKKYVKKNCYLQNRIKKLSRKDILNELDKDMSILKLSKKITPTLALFLQGQIRNYNKKRTGRRWTKEEKIVALRIYKRSPTCYRLLRRLFCIPSPGTLKNLLNKIPFGVGLNKPLFKVLKKIVASQKQKDNVYTLMFDEMSIKKNLHYNIKEDMIEGFQDHDNHGRSPMVASYALVFMISGVRKKIKQPIAHYFSSGFSTADRLAVLIKEVLNECFEANINIVALVCDMDGVNRRAYAALGATMEHPFIKFNNKEICTFYDTPHLLKCFRNLFIKYDIECSMDITSDDKTGKGIAKWAYVKEFYELDNNNPNFVYAPALTKDHLNPNTRQKMKVSMACQVLSSSVAGGMFAKIGTGEMTTDAITTCNVINNIDKLFDSLNSDCSDLRRGKTYATNLSPAGPHWFLFEKMKKFFKDMKYIGCPRKPPSQEGWIWTLNATEKLWKCLENDFQINRLATRRIQQDALENLFGCIRGNCGANTNPTCGQFLAALKTAILSKLAHTANTGPNCEADDNEVISNFDTFLSTKSARICTVSGAGINENTSSVTSEESPEINDLFDNDDSPEIQACAYVCGFLLTKISSDCKNCKKSLFSSTIERHHMFVECREYEDYRKSLNYATKDMVTCVENCASLINTFLKENGHSKYIKTTVTKIMKEKVNFAFLDTCQEHKDVIINKLLHHVFVICVKRFCVVKNRDFAHEASAAALKRKMNILIHK